MNSPRPFFPRMLLRVFAAAAMTLCIALAETAQAHVFTGCAGNKVAPFGVTDANSCVNPEHLAFADHCIRVAGVDINTNPSQDDRNAYGNLLCEPSSGDKCRPYTSWAQTSFTTGTRYICTPVIKSGFTECPPGLQHSPESHECTWLPPVAVRVDADLANEMFTLSWRPPEIAATATIIGYHIRRTQNNVPVGQNAHPTRCDELTENQFKRSDNGAARSDYPFLNSGITVVAADVFTLTVRTARPAFPEESYGSCYRWHIAAFTEQRGGAEAIPPSSAAPTPDATAATPARRNPGKVPACSATAPPMWKAANGAQDKAEHSSQPAAFIDAPASTAPTADSPRPSAFAT